MGIRSLKTASVSTGVKRSKFWDGTSVYVPPSYESIATITVGSGGSSSITFSSIPSTYKHLQVRYMGRCSVAGEQNQGLFMRINSDSGSNYSRHMLYGNGSSAAVNINGASQTYVYAGFIPGAAATSSSFAGGVIDIIDYASSNKTKTVRNLVGYDANGSGIVNLSSGTWYNTSTAVNSLTFLVELAGGSFSEFTQFSLYGIR